MLNVSPLVQMIPTLEVFKSPLWGGSQILQTKQNKINPLYLFIVNLCNCNGRWYRSGESFILQCAMKLLLSHDCKPKASFLMWPCQLRMKWICVENNKRIQIRDQYFLQKNHFPVVCAYFRLGLCKPQESDVCQIYSAILWFWKGRVSFWETFIPCSLCSCFQYWNLYFKHILLY